VSTWSVVFLGVIAVATLATAIVQVGLLMAAGALMRRLTSFVDEVEREMKPILGNLDTVSRDASRAAALAVAQVERVDEVCADLARRIDQTVSTIQTAVIKPVREGRALFLGLQAIVAAIREFRANPARARTREEEDGLFI
jgi:hypothetical protein